MRVGTRQGIRSWALGVLAFVLCGTGAMAQVASSSLRGQVLDPSGAPLPGTTVTAELIGTGLRTSSVTDSDGRFFIGGLRPGAYTVAAELVGFRRAVQEGLFLRLRDTLALEFQLELAGVEAEVVVTAEAPVLDTTQPAVSQAVTEQEIEALPLNDRDFMDLALLTPGVKEGRDPTMLGTQVAIGAQDSSSTLVSTDGVDTTSHFIGGTFQTFIQETIQEYRVVTSNFGAEFGRTNSGAITVVTRSGTNQLQGSVWEYFRTAKLQAKPEFLDEDPDFQRHQFGGVFSGPIVRDRTHFIVAYERRDQDATIATPAAALQAIPTLEVDFPTTLVTNNLFLKVDQQLGNNQHVALRFTHEDRETINSPNLTGFDASKATRSNYFREDQSTNFALLNHTFSPFANSFNQLTLSYIKGSRPNERNTQDPEEIRPSSRQGGFFLAGFDDSEDRSIGLAEDFTVQLGRHTLKLGGDLQLRHLQLLFPVFSVGQFTFNCIPALPIGPGGALVPDPLGCSADRSFNAQNPFSYPVALIQGRGNPLYEQDRTVVGLFVSDEIRVSDRVNVSVGVRWDYDSDQFNSSFTSPLVDERNPIVPLRTALASSGVLDTPAKDFDNFAPRLGVTWDVTGDGKTLVRGGAGVYYSFLIGTLSLFPQVISGLATPAGIIGDYAVNVTFLPDYRGVPNILRGGAAPTVAPLIYAMDPDAKTPYTIQETVGVARAIGDEMAFAVDLVAAQGYNEIVTVDVNAPRQLRGDTNGDGIPEYDPRSRPLPFGPIRTFMTIGESDYKALQLTFQKRYSRGWQLQANYTLSKSTNWMDNPTSQLPVDSNAPELEEGPTSQDQRHVVNLSGMVDLPLGLQLSSAVRMGSGAPYNVTVPFDLNNDGFFNDRGIDPATGKLRERNSANADTYFRLDARLSKEFGFGDRLRLLLMAEAFNLTNHANYDPDTYNGVIGSEGFGQPTSSINQTFDPRQIQLGARLRF
jgi:hypothetical protein